MLLKLFKYDAKKLARFLLPIAIAIVATSVLLIILNPLVNKYFMSDSYTNFDAYPDNAIEQLEYFSVNMIGMLIFLGYALCVALLESSLLIMFVFTFIYFYREMFTGRGYFTMSLPAKPSEILFSKFLVSFLAMLFTILIIAIDVFVNVFMFIGNDIFPAIFDFLADRTFLAVYIPVLGLVVIVFIILLTFTLSLFGFSVAKKHKNAGSILWTVGGVYGTGIVLYVISIITIVIGSMLYEYIDPSLGLLFETVSCIILFLIVSGADVGLWFISKNLLSKKVELT